MKARTWLVLGLVACNRPTQVIEGINDTGSLSGEWHGLSEESSWTFRDDRISDDAPEPAELVLGRYTGDGRMELRRGERWADAEEIGSLVFDLDNGLSLSSWNVDGSSGEGAFPIYEGEPAQDVAASNGSWTCEPDLNEDVDTFYGIFPSCMRVGCTVGGVGTDGSGGQDTGDASVIYGVTGTPAGFWSFAPGVGLIRVQAADFELNLVAPW